MQSTPKPVDGPLLKLLERDICSGRIGVKVETMGIFEVFVLGSSKLLLSVIGNVAPFRLAMEVLSQHFAVVVVRTS